KKLLVVLAVIVVLVAATTAIWLVTRKTSESGNHNAVPQTASPEGSQQQPKQLCYFELSQSEPTPPGEPENSHFIRCYTDGELKDTERVKAFTDMTVWGIVPSPKDDQLAVIIHNKDKQAW